MAGLISKKTFLDLFLLLLGAGVAAVILFFTSPVLFSTLFISIPIIVVSGFSLVLLRWIISGLINWRIRLNIEGIWGHRLSDWSGLISRKTFILDLFLLLLGAGVVTVILFFASPVLFSTLFISIPTIVGSGFFLIFCRWISFYLVKRRIRLNIEMGIRDFDPNKSHLLRFLAIANNGNVDENNSWHYSINNKSISEYALDQHNTFLSKSKKKYSAWERFWGIPTKNKLASQAYGVGGYLCYKAKQNQSKFKLVLTKGNKLLIFFKWLNNIDYSFNQKDDSSWNEEALKKHMDFKEEKEPLPLPKRPKIAIEPLDLKKVINKATRRFNEQKDKDEEAKKDLDTFIQEEIKKQNESSQYPDIRTPQKIKKAYIDSVFPPPKESNIASQEAKLLEEIKEKLSGLSVQKDNEEKEEKEPAPECLKSWRNIFLTNSGGHDGSQTQINIDAEEKREYRQLREARKNEQQQHIIQEEKKVEKFEFVDNSELIDLNKLLNDADAGFQENYTCLRENSKVLNIGAKEVCNSPIGQWLDTFKNQKIKEIECLYKIESQDIHFNISDKARMYFLQNKANFSEKVHMIDETRIRPLFVETNVDNNKKSCTVNIKCDKSLKAQKAVDANQNFPGFLLRFENNNNSEKYNEQEKVLKKMIKSYFSSKVTFPHNYLDASSEDLLNFVYTSYLLPLPKNTRLEKFSPLLTKVSKKYGHSFSQEQIKEIIKFFEGDLVASGSEVSSNPFIITLLKCFQQLDPELCPIYLNFFKQINKLCQKNKSEFKADRLFDFCASTSTDLSTLNSYRALKMLKNLLSRANNDDKKAQSALFIASCLHESDLKNIHGLFHFIDCCYSLKLDPASFFLKAPSSYDEGGWSSTLNVFGSILDIIVEAGKKGEKHKKVQAEYLAGISSHIRHPVLYLSALKSGYCVTHPHMFDFKENEGEGIEINKDLVVNVGYISAFKEYSKFELRNKPFDSISRLRGLFLRHVAFHYSIETFEKALVEYKKIVGEDILRLEGKVNFWGIDESKVIRIKEELVAYLKKLENEEDTNKSKENINPTHLKKLPKLKIETGDLILRRGRPNYQPDHLDDLLESLEIYLTQKEGNQLKSDIVQLNNLIEKYTHYSLKKLKEVAESYKKDPKAVDKIELLALVREVVFKKSGLWLRLEQVISILFPYKIQANQDSLTEKKTSEGKTLVFHCIALLAALSGEKVDVVTHQENLSVFGAAELLRYANVLGLHVASHESKPSDIVQADVYYSDMGTAIGQDILSIISPIIPYLNRDNKSKVVHDQRQATWVLLDEVDFLLLDFNADLDVLRSVYLDKSSSAKPEFVEFLNAVNRLVREEKLIENSTDKQNKLSARSTAKRYLTNQLKGNNPYLKDIEKEEFLDKWIRAAICAAEKVNKEDYNVEEMEGDSNGKLHVRIMHRKSGQQIDTRSKWGRGVHCCVAAWVAQLAKADNHKKSIFIPSESFIIGQGDLEHYISRYKKVVGYTGTFRSEKSVNKMRDIISSKVRNESDVSVEEKEEKKENDSDEDASKKSQVRILKMFRAFRENKKGEYNWPKVGVKSSNKNKVIKRQYRSVYNRGVYHPPMYFKTREDYLDAIVKILKKEALQKVFLDEEPGRALVILNSIKECETLYFELLQKGICEIGSENLEILDHTKGKFRLTLELAIGLGKKPLSVIIGTNIAGRGQDFKQLNCVIYSDHKGLPGSSSQGLDRGGRNMDRANRYEAYLVPKLDKESRALFDQDAIKFSTKKQRELAELDSTDLRGIIEQQEARLEQQQLEALDDKSTKRRFMTKMSEQFIKFFNTLSEDQKFIFAPHWMHFFTKINESYHLDFKKEAKIKSLKSADMKIEETDNAWDTFLNSHKSIKTIWEKTTINGS